LHGRRIARNSQELQRLNEDGLVVCRLGSPSRVVKLSRDETCVYSATTHPELCTIDSFLTTDFFIGYKGFNNLELDLTIKNLDNRQPPIDANLALFLSLGNSTFHDLMGSYFVASAKYTFW
jgi:iron complex outermembrane receptor protein